jgi:alpha-glucan,water dikinase
MEDIPQGVTAVLTESTTDVLSHVAIRARSQGVLLATCFDDGEWQKLTAMQVGSITLSLRRQQALYQATDCVTPLPSSAR